MNSQEWKGTDFIKFLLANICMETLLGLKPSSLIQIPLMESKEKVLEILTSVIKNYNCNYEVLHVNNIRLTVLIYHTLTLNQCISNRENIDYLREKGFFLESCSIESIFPVIRQKLEGYHNNIGRITSNESHIDEYPHEIGIVLGYPLEDVLGFITNHGQNYIFSGCWKVYHNASYCKKLFKEYHRIRVEAVKYLIENNALPII